MSQRLHLLKQELSVSQILRIYGKQYTQITESYSDGHNGRCAIGVLMSYFGWDGNDDLRTVLIRMGVNKDLVIQLNDSGMSFDEIADYLDQHHELTPNELVWY